MINQNPNRIFCSNFKTFVSFVIQQEHTNTCYSEQTRRQWQMSLIIISPCVCSAVYSLIVFQIQFHTRHSAAPTFHHSLGSCDQPLASAVAVIIRCLQTALRTEITPSMSTQLIISCKVSLAKCHVYISSLL